MSLADRFSSIDELLASDDNELYRLGITNQADRTQLIKQAELLHNNKTNQSLTSKRRSVQADPAIETWSSDRQGMLLNANALSKSTSNLSPAMLARLSYNDRPASAIYPYDESTNEVRKSSFSRLTESREKIITLDDNGRIQTKSALAPFENQSVLKKTPSRSTHGMRTIKSLSDTISIQKKSTPNADRLKRLDSATSLFHRQTSLISKKVTSLANKLVNPFAIIKKKVERPSATNLDSQVDLRSSIKRQVSLVDKKSEVAVASQRTITITPVKRTRDDIDDSDESEPKERRKVQILNMNNTIHPQRTVFSVENPEPRRHVAPVQTLGSKRFKLGATTSFLTRSLANHGLIE